MSKGNFATDELPLGIIIGTLKGFLSGEDQTATLTES